MSESAPSLFGESEPPDVEPQVVQAAGGSSSFWSNKGKTKQRKRGANDGAVVEEETDQPEFTGISLVELEFTRAKNNDGGASSVASEAIGARVKRKKRSTAKKPAAEMMSAAAFGGGGDDDEKEEEEEDEEEGEEEEDGAVEKNRAITRKRVVPASMTEEDDSDEDEREDESVVGAGQQIRSDRCIGCCFDREIIGKIDSFVRTHCVSMTEQALYRAASQYWQREIVKPRAQEGVHVPKWHWKQLANHYSLHAVDPLLQRASNLRVVSAMREFQAQKLLRVNPDGSKALDTKAGEMMMKLIALSDKHIAALDSARMPPPPPRGSR
jgi:hypothetical protein